MIKYIEIYNMGFEEGFYFAYVDFCKNKRKTFKKIDDSIIKDKLYDLGYINAYNLFYGIMKNHL